MAAGATFKTLGRKRTPQGKAVIARHLDELDEAEARSTRSTPATIRAFSTVRTDRMDRRGVDGEGMPNEMIADLLGDTSTRMVGDQ